MAVRSRLRSAFRRRNTDEFVAPEAVTTEQAFKIDPSPESGLAPGEGFKPENSPEGSSQNDNVQPQDAHENTQRGVNDVEAVTATWSKAALIAVFINIWFLYFVNAFQSSILSSLLPYVTSDWDSHSLLTTIYVVADAVTAAVYIPLAKILDVWGRAEGFALMTLFATMGLVMMAACHNLPTFCAAYVFYTLGFGGMTYTVDVITADSSRLKNRALAYAFTSSPYIITAFAGPKAAEEFEEKYSWRWGFGAFAIIFPIVAAPLFVLFKVNLRKAASQGALARESSGRTLMQSIWHYIVEFDAFGVFVFSAGLTVFFLPFEIADSAPHGWSTGYIIAMIVVGVVMLAVFVIHELYIAPVPMIKFSFIRDRTVIGACLLDATYQIAYYCWANYFTSFLQVVNDLTLSEAGYVSNTFDVVSGVLLFLVGWSIHKTGRFKWLLYIAVPLYIFAQGLMIYFRRPNQSVGYLVMCQIFISIGGSIFIIIEQLAILAAVDHQHVAAVLALLNVVGTVGDAMGNTISGAIWTNTFRKALKKDLPASELPNIDDIVGNLDTQKGYPIGSAARLGVQKAYGYAQTRMLAAGTGIMVLCFIWTAMIRNINVHKVAQVKGVVF
ncbi:Putative Siderophore iron transporter mirB [Aspergillus calidoustus]|uniref:Putative Siderophore iron transporter mirB n=1 Tax=Aspergillus calidoustus TaxID=454130 RepID=A0A0U5C685_ASPCI|nr:Putative Siderophore iron transporter mirB [Aspergillus calidoustus]